MRFKVTSNRGRRFSVKFADNWKALATMARRGYGALNAARAGEAPPRGAPSQPRGVPQGGDFHRGGLISA
jgi:hypothetical protein